MSARSQIILWNYCKFIHVVIVESDTIAYRKRKTSDCISCTIFCRSSKTTTFVDHCKCRWWQRADSGFSFQEGLCNNHTCVQFMFFSSVWLGVAIFKFFATCWLQNILLLKRWKTINFVKHFILPLSTQFCWKTIKICLLIRSLLATNVISNFVTKDEQKDIFFRMIALKSKEAADFWWQVYVIKELIAQWASK